MKMLQMFHRSSLSSSENQQLHVVLIKARIDADQVDEAAQKEPGAYDENEGKRHL